MSPQVRRNIGVLLCCMIWPPVAVPKYMLQLFQTFAGTPACMSPQVGTFLVGFIVVVWSLKGCEQQLARAFGTLQDLCRNTGSHEPTGGRISCEIADCGVVFGSA
jgi:hypothetical protein